MCAVTVVEAAHSAEWSEAPEKKSLTCRFHCPACGHSFTRRTRLGIYARCRCGARAYGETVVQDLARPTARAPKAKPERPPRARVQVLPAPAPSRAPASDPPITQTAPAPSASPPRPLSLFDRLLGRGDLD
jgi:ribosomal protein L37AE/L43A